MITLEELIKKELKLSLEHEPTEEELKALYAFLETRDIDYLITLDNAISKWVKDNTVACSWCGHRWLPIEMINGINEHFCCDQCKADWKTEHGAC